MKEKKEIIKSRELVEGKCSLEFEDNKVFSHSTPMGNLLKIFLFKKKKFSFNVSKKRKNEKEVFSLIFFTFLMLVLIACLISNETNQNVKIACVIAIFISTGLYICSKIFWPTK